MASTFLLINYLRYYFQSNEEARKYICIKDNSTHKAKFWLEPEVETTAESEIKYDTTQ
ncbi:MAG: hypothetical protein LBI45_08700 [Bacteroidales bacterium]|nr:hypothetical protein [Bacteroidales bacterium]